MNFIQQLFHRRKSPSVESAVHHWPGQSGKEYQFEIFPMDATFKALPGVYVYAKQLSDGDWSPVYISQTRDLHQRLEGHVTLQDAIEHGATHIHAHYSDVGHGARCSEEQDLIHRWQPECNDVFAG